MKSYTPSEYAREVCYGKVTSRTVHNWIDKGLMPDNVSIELTPSGRKIIIVNDKPKSNIENLVALMKTKARVA
jgi:hypothetical protein